MDDNTDDNTEQDQNESEGSCHRTNQDHVLSKDIKKSGPSAFYRGRRSPVQHPQPPPPQLTADRNCSSTASISDSHMKDSSNDLLKSLSNWSKTDRRGREDKSVAWVAQVLLSLSRGDDSTRPNQILPASNGGSTNGNSVNDSKKSAHSISCMDERTGGFDMEKQRMKMLVMDETKGGKDQEYGESKNTKSGNSPSDEPSKDNYQIRTKEKLKMTKKVTSLVGHSETEEEEEELGLINKTQKMPRSYKCSDCGKSYPTYQALGGHRSIHKVNKKEKTTSIASSVGDDQEENNPNDSFKTDETKKSDEWSGEA